VERLFLLTGEDSSRKQAAIHRIRDKFLDKANSEFNYHVFYPNEADLSEIFQCANTAGFLSEYRLVVIKEVSGFKAAEKQKIAAFIKQQPQSCILVLDATNLQPKDPISKAVASVGRSATVQSYPVSAQQAQALQKDRWAAFKLADAVGSKKCTVALNLLNKLSFDAAEPVEVIGALGWHLRRLWKAKQLAGRGYDKLKIARSIGIRSFLMDSFFRQVIQSSIEDIEAAISELLKIDFISKSRRSQTYYALEQFIIKFCKGSYLPV